MIKTLTTHGNSAALIIDKAILELLKIGMDTPLEIVTDGRNLIISPVQDAGREERVKKALVKVNARHGATLKKLAAPGTSATK
ncbi:MAG: AbrB/MazE/SpoVT family DNA-binding domain-containing protein [Chloroflexi bacterium]|nr:AbrB/MazE/SpoVT family DNA-binding domain-containing protein [Chloroflexota bacterium]